MYITGAIGSTRKGEAFEESYLLPNDTAYAETCAALYANGVYGPKGINYIYGLGGRDVRVESIKTVFAELEKIAATGATGETYRYLDVRE